MFAVRHKTRIRQRLGGCTGVHSHSLEKTLKNGAVDGTQALELYKNAREAGEPFVAVIMDLTIPGGMGGKEAIKKLLDLDPQAKVIVSSGYSNDPILSRFHEYGFKGMVAKAFLIAVYSRGRQKDC
jgi:DNA-binding NarL/FixJ family response regulator